MDDFPGVSLGKIDGFLFIKEKCLFFKSNPKLELSTNTHFSKGTFY